jgi:hypothetical protein
VSSWARGRTSKSRLEADWQTPGSAGASKQADAGRTVSGEAKDKGLSLQAALMKLRGDDPRPLLILRDCDGCKNKEGDLLKRTLVNERLLLASGWFHCVRFSHEVMNPEHPYHVIFDHERHPHIALASWDLKTFTQVHRAGAKDVWKAMKRVIGKDYKKSPESAMKNMIKILSEYDALDDREQALKTQLNTKRERGKEARARILEKELTALAEEREELIEDEMKLRDLVFKKIKEREKLLGENA